MATASVTTNAIPEPELTAFERKQFDRMAGVMGQLGEILPLIKEHAVQIINVLPVVADEQEELAIIEAVDRSTEIKLLSDLAMLITAVEQLRNTGESCRGTSLHEIYERTIPYPVHADSAAQIKAAKQVL